MARPKKIAAEPVHIRFREQKHGGRSVYLEINVEGRRKYETLGLTLVPERGPEDKALNEHAMKAAYALKAQRLLALTGGNNRPSLTVWEKAKMPLIDWIKEYQQARIAHGRVDLKTIECCLIYLERYKTRIKLGEVDTDFIDGFVKWMNKQKNRLTGEPLSPNSIARYVGTIRAALNSAVENGYLPSNPIESIDWEPIRCVQTQRAYLTLEEVAKLVHTPYRRQDVTQPFLFACFCGLRGNDIRQLKWRDIHRTGDKVYIEMVQQKTGTTLCLPLSQHALEFLPEAKGAAGDLVFNVPDIHVVSKHLKLWGQAAGITKKITMHVARHTFATMTLTSGTDLYTTSRLLGHADVVTTQVYGKIVDSKKQQAVFLIDQLFDPELYF